ncbi:MAG TPA: acetylglutamate kinase [Fimbriimonas sp.]|nr:acetylglutamate kinase [Fimbriimonas sp.]
MLDAQTQAEVLNQALPYIQAFRGQTFVIKYGGSAMKDPALMVSVIRNVLLLQLVGIRPILVHGGGPEIDFWLQKLGIEKQTRNGIRVTDEQTMDVVEMALAGRANKSLVAEVQKAGGKAIGLSGRDSDLLQAEVLDEALGRVGKIRRVDNNILRVASEAGYIPVVCSVATDDEHRALNINADTAAAAIASSVEAAKLILLTDTNGVLEDKDNPTSTISKLTPPEVRRMIEDGRADRGMIPKLEAALHAVQNGVPSVHLINGGIENALLIEVFTDAGIGTMMSS